MSAKKNFSFKLKKLREENGLSQTQLSEKLGVSRVTISYYENQERTADIDFIFKTAELFNCSTDYLLGLSNIKSLDAQKTFEGEMKTLSDTIGQMSADDNGFWDNLLLLVLNIQKDRSAIGCFSRVMEFYRNMIECTETCSNIADSANSLYENAMYTAKLMQNFSTNYANIFIYKGLIENALNYFIATRLRKVCDESKKGGYELERSGRDPWILYSSTFDWDSLRDSVFDKKGRGR